MAELDLSQVNVIVELDAMGWGWDSAGGDGTEIRCRCPNPQHDDKSPSCQINVEKRLFKCMVPTCGARGDFVSFMALALNQPRLVAYELLARKYGLRDAKVIAQDAVERYHSAIWSTAPMLRELRLRGVSDEVIRRRRLGFDRGRVTIPIYDEYDEVVNVRRYLPGAPGPEKIRNTRGYGKIRLYPVDQLKYDTIIVTGGEMKAVVGAEHMNPHDIGVITATAGEGNWEPEFSRAMRGKRVYVATDIDDEGRAAAQTLCARNKAEARWIGDVLIPLDRVRYPKGDLNDFFGTSGGTAAQLLAVLEQTQEWFPPKRENELDASGEPELIHLANVTEAKNTGRRVTVRAVVSQQDESPYLVPRDVACECGRNQAFCAICPVFASQPDPDTGMVVLTVHAQSPAILAMIDAPRKSQREAVREGLNIPPCKSVTLHTRSHYNVEDVQLTPQLEISSRAHDSVTRPAFFVGHGLQSNASYRFDGRVYAHPKDQHAVLLASKAEPIDDTLDSFDPTDAELMELSVFQPREWTMDGLREKLDDLYADLEANVTHIYQRRDLHLVLDLMWHSILTFDFDKREVKGWVEVVVVGDSSQGKSDTAIGLLRHYGVGERVECKNMTAAGLMGGCDRIRDRWIVKWGVVPLHDRRAVLLEELKGTSTDVIGKLTDMRSTGVAEVNKIEKRKTHARTRLAAISNPRSDRTISSYNFGCEAIKELVGNLEDVRRFDLAYLVTSSQVDAKRLNVLMQSRPKVVQRHTSDLCRRLILWAWTRDPDQVTFTDEATKAIMTWSVNLCTTYSDVLPLVDRGSIRLKLARLATALACRTFSRANTDARHVVVRDCHVELVAKFMDDTYSSREFGYKDFSRALIAADALIDEDVLRRRVLEVPFARDFVEQVLNTSEIELRDLCDWCGWEFEQGRDLLSFLVRKHALVRQKSSYRKTAGFIEFLKRVQQDGVLDKLKRPDFLKDEHPREI
jgi:hypothetical protein